MRLRSSARLVGIDEGGEPALLAAEPLEAGVAVGLEAARGDGSPDGAARLAPVTAVRETARRRQLFYLPERVPDRLVPLPQRKGAKARRVDEHRPTR